MADPDISSVIETPFDAALSERYLVYALSTIKARSLPDVRRGAFRDLAPDLGPATAHPTAGAVAVGARPLLVAWNVYLAVPDLARARAIPCARRQPE